MNFNDIKISTRLIVLTGSLCTLLVGVGVLGLFGINASNDALRTVYEDRTVPIGQLAEIQRMQQVNQLAIADALDDPTPGTVSSNVAKVVAPKRVAKPRTDFVNSASRSRFTRAAWYVFNGGRG